MAAEEKGKRRIIENVKKTDTKVLIRAVTIIWGLLLIVIMTVANIGITKEFDWKSWLSNSGIIFGIMVFFLLMGESSGKDSQMKREDGRYQVALDDYTQFLESINEETIYFDQYYTQLLSKELEEKQIDYLRALGVKSEKASKIVKYCSKSDLNDLKSHIFEVFDSNKNRIAVIRKLEDFEIDPVTDVLSGKITLNSPNSNYYLSAFSEPKVNRRIVEVPNYLDEERKSNKRKNRVFKILSQFGISLAWGVLTVNEFMDGNDIAAWVNLISRITAAFTSYLSGWISSVIDVKIMAEILDNKLKVLQMYHTAYKKKLFIPIDEKQMEEKELEEYHKSQEEAVASVVEKKDEMLAIGTGDVIYL